MNYKRKAKLINFNIFTKKISMEKQPEQFQISQVKKTSQFDLTQGLNQVAKHIDPKSQEQIQISAKLITDLNMNARQKLKHYKKVLQSEQKQNLSKEKANVEFINKHLKIVLLQEYLRGNTQAKLNLFNLLKALSKITYADINQAIKGSKIQQLNEIKSWSQILDLVFRQYHLQPSQEQFNGFNYILVELQRLMYEGMEMILKNEFKSKWLATFVEILRTENIVVRVFSKYIEEERKEKLIRACRAMIEKWSFLSKQVVSQLFLMLVFLSPQQPSPSEDNQMTQIHYIHAQSVVKGTNNVKQLVGLIPKLKQTQHKCQLMLILEQSFIQYYNKLTLPQDKPFKDNVFDQVINLFQVGRSIYGYLQTVVKLIIEAGDHWNMEGNFVRKFFIATIVLKLLPSKLIIEQWPTIVEDVIVQCGNMSVPYAFDCAKILFQKLYNENDKNYEKWASFWIDSYKSKLLHSNEKGSIRGIIDFINPILLKVCSKPFLLKQLLDLSNKQSNPNLQLGVIALIRCYKEIGQIQVNEKEHTFQHSLDKNITFSYNKIRNFLLSNDEMIALQALELVTTSLKPSQFVKPMEMKLCIEFYRHASKTSAPEYRKNYLGVTKKLMERLRNIYDTILVAGQMDKKSSKKLFYNEFVEFLKELIDVCFLNVFPQAIYELVNPALEILQLIQNNFSGKRIENKKGYILQPTQILKQTSFYHFTHFENLLSCLQSSYESVRKLAHDLLNQYDQLDRKELLLQLWEISLKNTNKLAIRSYEYACRILTFISDVYPDILSIENKYPVTELNVLNFFFNLTKQRYQIFKDQFVKQGSNYYHNLVHGLLTIFSYQIDNLAEQLSNPETYKTKYENVANDIKDFLSDFFTEIVHMLNFAVEISSSNVATVILDTLTQGSQTDKKLKVDCRGHFLNEGSNIGSFLESTALISSMQDDEQGIENTLVVSFYLLTREAGLVFQSIGGLLANENSSSYIPSQNLIRLINTYFYALVNLKHMGSVDRISKGLGKMSRVIFDNESKELSKLPETLLNKLLHHLKEGSFTNILRRSAGVPFAFCCLLKSASLKRGKLVEQSINQLLALSRESKETPIELRIHALNIMKKLFQDSDLKGDLDLYVSDAFISSIKGFTSEQWGVRNSSLMLFTALSNRTVGVKPIYNLLEFFLKCPSLLEFIQNELNNFSDASFNTMYPPLYPIVLLFSRLLPFDMKERSKIIPKDSMKHIRKEQLLSLLPILDRAGINTNYMGRVMTAKAILPFMEIDDIQSHCVEGIEKLPQYFNTDNNMLHYQLTKYYHLLTSYNEICKSSMRNIEISKQALQRLWSFIATNIKTITELNCPVAIECFAKVFRYFFENFNTQMIQQFQNYPQVLQDVTLNLRSLTNKYVFETENFVIVGDLGHSMMRKEVVAFELDLLIRYSNNFESFKNLAVQFTQYLSTKLQQNECFFQTSDNEICEFYLKKIRENIKNLKQQQKVQLFKSMTGMLSKLELSGIRSDIIISTVLELRTAIEYKSAKNEEQVKFLLDLQNKSNNHFLQIAIFKYLTYVKASEEELTRLLMKFSDPNSLEELRECAVEYIETLQQYEPKLNIVYIRLLEDEEYEIRKYTANIVATQLKTYSFNQTVTKNNILAQITTQDLIQLLTQNSDFKIKRKNHEEVRIFSYDKPNKFRSDATTLFEVLLANKNIAQSIQTIKSTFSQSLNEPQMQNLIVETYKSDIIGRTQYQFELLVRQLVLNINTPNLTEQKAKEISLFHPLFAQLVSSLQTQKQ